MDSIQDKKTVAVIHAFTTMHDNTVPSIKKQLESKYNIFLLESTISKILNKYLKQKMINGGF